MDPSQLTPIQNTATGGIAASFARDLTVDPTTRGNTIVKHTVVAAASSSSAAKAQAFLKDVDAAATAKAYGSYAEFVKDGNVDVVYVATPHSHHYQNTMLCLEAGKNVLCEKAFTVNAAQCKKLVQKAREKVSSKPYPKAYFIHAQDRDQPCRADQAVSFT